MKRKMTILLCIGALALGALAGCSNNTSTENPTPAPTESNSTPATAESEEDPGEVAMTPGEYTETVHGYNGAYEITVTVSEDEILSIVAGENDESPGVGTAAIELMTADMLAYNTANVDVVTGATVSSAVFRNAVTAALRSADAPASFFVAPVIEQEDANISTDVLVIGAGAAGLAAAITAAQGGADVVLIEKQGIVGGSTIISAGIVYSALDENDYDNMVNYYMDRAEGKANRELLTYYAENSLDSIEFLNEAGVQWMMTVPSGTAPEPRAHFSMGQHGPMFGVALTEPMLEKALALGVTVMTNTAANELLTDDAGAVVGAVATTRAGATITFDAGAVVLATGGWDASPELKAQYAPWSAPHIPLSSKGSMGEGLVMGLAVGADSVFNGGMVGFIAVDPILPDSGRNPLIMGAPLYVAADGGYVALNIDYPITHTQMREHDVNEGFAIFGAAGETTAANAEAVGVSYHMGNTIEELATAAGMDAEKLAAAIEQAPAIEEGPYYAVVARPTSIGSMGGLKTNTDAEVLSAANNEPIPGLYAAGEVANGEFYYQEYPASGSSIALAITFGRAAGTHAAEFVAQ